MPNHVHLLLSPGEDITLERAVQLIKDGFSFRAAREGDFRGGVWQRGYVDHRVRDPRDYLFHREYIHQNPVRSRLVVSPAEYKFSSANPIYILESAPQGLKPNVDPA